MFKILLGTLTDGHLNDILKLTSLKREDVFVIKKEAGHSHVYHAGTVVAGQL